MTCFRYLDRGSGLPLVMFHGMMGLAENWAGTFEHLPDTCRAIALHFPFFESGEMDSVPTVADYAQRFLDEQGIQQAVLCGNSLGGHVALNLALRCPDRVLGLVLTGSSGLFERTFGSVTPHPPRSWVYDKVSEIFHDPVHASDELVDTVYGIISSRANVRLLVKIAKSAKRDNLAEKLPGIRCPVLLVWGRQDQITPPSVAEEFHQRLPDSELVWMDACGHATMMEYPEGFAKTVGDWWNRRIASCGAERAGGKVT